jgi:hypothetical protein
MNGKVLIEAVLGEVKHHFKRAGIGHWKFSLVGGRVLLGKSC